MKFLVSFSLIALFVVLCNAEDSAANDQPAAEAQQEDDQLQLMAKRIPHPSWRTMRVQHFQQQGELPPLTPRQFSFNGPRRFYRYARRPFSIDFDF